MRRLFVVGNKINKHIGIEHCISVNEFFALLKKNSCTEAPVNVVLGQGISLEDRDLLVHEINNSSSYYTDNTLSSKNMAEKHLTHKQKKQNILITHPELIEDSFYKALLYIDERCAEMSDHVTGLHIQGMVLIEAARQMCTAVAEEYWVPENNSRAFILEKLNTQFIDFVFFGNVDIELKMKKKRELLRGDFQVTCEVNFIQNNKICVSVDVQISTMEKTLFANVEQERANVFFNTEAR